MNIQPGGPRKAYVQRYGAAQTPSRPVFAQLPRQTFIEPNHAVAFWIGAVFTFLTFSHTIEFIDSSSRFHLALIDASLGALALLMTGNGPAMLLSKQGAWLTAFTFWVFIGLPFSLWKGGSINIFLSTYIKSYIAFFLIGGLIFNLQQMRRLFLVLAVGTSALAYITYRAGVTAEDDRVSASYGSLGNANDLATTILMGLPFLIFIATDKKTNLFIRCMAAPMVAVLLGIVLKTGSRGALIGIAVMGTVAFFKVSLANKMKLVVVVLFLAGLFPFIVSKDLRNRYLTIFTDKGAAVSANVDSAIQSSNARRELMKHAVTLTLTHPVFGVGLGQFSVQSANLWIAKGEHPLWFTAHDIYLLVSSETGIPAVILYCGLIVSCFRTLLRLSKAEKQNPELALPSHLAFAILLSLVAYSVCGIFNTQAFSMQLPMLAALTAALTRVSAPQLAAAGLLQPAQFAPMPQFVNRKLTGPGPLANNRFPAPY